MKGKIELLRDIPCGKNARYMTKGTIHDLVECPDEHKEKYNDDPWIMGTVEPVRIVSGEYKILKDDK